MASQTPLGRAQSPIDLGSAVGSPPVDLDIKYRKSTLHGEKSRTTLEFAVAGGSSISYDGRRYELEQFHFHAPSEHAVDGELADGEVHFVHSDPEGNRLVLGVFIDGSESAKGPRRIEQALAVANLLPEARTHYAYEGSLTTPPFTEGVQWIVMTDHVALQPSWIESFSERFGDNNRALQAINDRTIRLT